jgi:predicted solute-binding protein
MKSRLAVSDALYLKPLLFGLERTESPFELMVDVPAINSLKLSKRSEEIRNAFLSPIDYARHGGEYCIVPHICAASSQRSNTIQLYLKSNLHNIKRIAVDVRYTSEIILTKIILSEKYRNQPNHQNLHFLPLIPDLDVMLGKADAALIVNDVPKKFDRQDIYMLDLVEEWNDLTNLPYVHGFWVGREEELKDEEAKALYAAKAGGMLLKTQIVQTNARQHNLSFDEMTEYSSAFSYDFGEKEEESLAEFIQYAYFHGIIGDVPEIRYFDVSPMDSSQN